MDRIVILGGDTGGTIAADRLRAPSPPTRLPSPPFTPRARLVDLFGLRKDDVTDQVQDIITVGGLEEKAAGGEFIVT